MTTKTIQIIVSITFTPRDDLTGDEDSSIMTPSEAAKETAEEVFDIIRSSVPENCAASVIVATDRPLMGKDQ